MQKILSKKSSRKGNIYRKKKKNKNKISQVFVNATLKMTLYYKIYVSSEVNAPEED